MEQTSGTAVTLKTDSPVPAMPAICRANSGPKTKGHKAGRGRHL